MSDASNPPKPKKTVADQIRDGLVGYQRPPQGTRFKKGQSGNPKGRPRKTKVAAAGVGSSDYDRILAAELARTQTVTEKGKPKRMTTGELVARQTMNTAPR